MWGVGVTSVFLKKGGSVKGRPCFFFLYCRSVFLLCPHSGFGGPRTSVFAPSFRLLYPHSGFDNEGPGTSSKTTLLETALLRTPDKCAIQEIFIDLLMGLFRGAVFRHCKGALKQPIKQPTETPTSTLALMGRFSSLMGRFPTLIRVRKRGLFEKGSFQKSPFSRDSREFIDSREPLDSGKQRRVRPFSRDSRDFRDSRDSSNEKTPFVMTPFSGPDLNGAFHRFRPKGRFAS